MKITAKVIVAGISVGAAICAIPFCQMILDFWQHGVFAPGYQWHIF